MAKTAFADDASGAGALVPQQLEPLSKFFGRRDLTEVWVNEPGAVWLRVADRTPTRIGAIDVTIEWAWDLCKFLANRNGVLFDEKMPVIACRIPGGHRFQAILGANVESRIAIAVRLKREKEYGYGDFGLQPGRVVEPPADLYSDRAATAENAPGGTELRPVLRTVSEGGTGSVATAPEGGPLGRPEPGEPDAAPERSLEDLLDIVRRGKPVLVSGGTNTGKTSLLNRLVREIPPETRIVTVEDAREINLPHQNKVHLVVSRTATGTNVDYGTIINAILRLSPDVVLLGEVSVDNSYPLLRLLNTGHEGFIGTIHANNPLEALEALKRNIELAGHSSRGAVPFLARTIARVVQIRKRDGEERKVVAIQRPMDLPWRTLMEA